MVTTGSPQNMPTVLALAGGVGGAKLAVGLSLILPPEDLTVCVNTGDDESFHGLHVSPDLDTMMYTLSGLSNEETGWGIAGDTFTTLEMLGKFGVDTWFNLGIIKVSRGEFGSARRSWENVLRLDPGDSTTSQFLRKLPKSTFLEILE